MKNVTTMIVCMALGMLLSCNANTKNEAGYLSTPTMEAEGKEHYIKVALLLDTSNSMDGLIDQAKAQLWEIVNELSYAKCRGKRPNFEIALYEYGNDNLSVKDGYTRKVLGFTNDLDEVSKQLFSLTTNGGSEYCGTVVKTATEDLDWGNDADDLKMIFIAGNEPYTQGKINYKDASMQAKEKDIVVNTIFCGNFQHGVESKWKDGAKIAYGDYIAIDHNREVVHVTSPYDDQILQLNIQLNTTYIPYGSKGRKKIAVQAEQDSNAESYGKANAVSRTISKGSHLYKNSTWDLVDAEEEKGFSYAEIEKEDLPGAMKDMSVAEMKNYVAEQRTNRSSIQKQIAELNNQRKKFISEKTSEATGNLGNAMTQALKRQAKKKDYSWE